MSDLPIIDSEAIENLRSLNPGDNDDFLKEIVAIFLEDTPLRIAELDQSLAAGDVGTFTRAAHTIKGSSSNVGALRLRHAAEVLEQGSRRDGLAVAATATGLSELKTQFAAAAAALGEYLPA